MPDPATLRDQERALRRRWDVVRCKIERIGDLDVLVAVLRLRPSETSATYRVEIRYAEGIRPHVYVREPVPVRFKHGIRTPHLNADDTLCLYDATTGEWTDADLLAFTTVPWTMRWIFHYEHWVTFGDWRGDAPPLTATTSKEKRE